jgi:hypothetical protein
MLRFRALSLSALAIVCTQFPAAAQTQTSWSEHTLYTISDFLSIIAHGDFNNDGREDIVVNASGQDQGASTGQYLLLSNGDGTYDAPIQLASTFSTGFIVGDFNHDGNLDYAVLDTAGKGVDIYQGHGDGTFTEVVVLLTDQNPSALVAVDLNHDNCTDIVVIANAGPQTHTMQSWLSACTTQMSFNGGQRIASGVLYASYAFTGDFDGDGKPDVALLSTGSPTTVQVWYGDGKGNLGNPVQATDPASIANNTPSVGDVDSNGTSDLLVTQGAQIGVFKGNTNRTLTFQTINTPSGQCPMYPEVADINGDGFNDLVYEEAACTSPTSSRVAADLATGKGVFSSSEQTIRSNPYWTSGFAIVKSTRSTRPDLAVVPATAASQSDFWPPSELVLMENTTSSSSFPGCGTAAQSEGINMCFPGTSSTTTNVHFSLSASGPTPMRAVAVWADGQKVAEQLAHAFSNYSFLDQSLTLSAGTHNITVYGTGWDNTLQQKSFTLTVGSGSGGSCATPTSAGIHICAPVNGSTVQSPVQVSAAATITGTLARMEIWVDGAKMYTETTNTSLSTMVALANGYHRFDIYAVNTAGTRWESTVYATVGTPSSCSAPSSASVHVCSPANNSTVSSPVKVMATATITGTLARMEVWVNGGKQYTETTSTSLSDSIALGAGKYQFDIYAVNTAGTKWETTVFATVP